MRRTSLVVIAAALAPACQLQSEDLRATDAGAPADAAGSADAGETAVVHAGDSRVALLNGISSHARFQAEDEGPGSCSREPAGACELAICEDAPEDAPRPDAGDIAIASPAAQVVLVPGADGHYPQLNGADALAWTPGEAIEISAAGGEVSAFSDTLTGPAEIDEVLLPVAEEGTRLVVSRAAPLELAWTGADERVSAFVRCGTGESRRTQIRCPLPAGAHTAAIPIDVLARLPDPCPDGEITLVAEDRHYVDLGAGYQARVSASGTPRVIDVLLQ